jgi:hypothetical protein
MKEQYPNHTCTPCYSPWWNSHLHQTNQNWSASSNSTNLLLTRTVTKWRQISGHEMPWLRHTWLPRSQVRQVYFLNLAKLQTLYRNNAHSHHIEALVTDLQASSIGVPKQATILKCFVKSSIKVLIPKGFLSIFEFKEFCGILVPLSLQ